MLVLGLEANLLALGMSGHGPGRPGHGINYKAKIMVNGMRYIR